MVRTYHACGALYNPCVYTRPLLGLEVDFEVGHLLPSAEGVSVEVSQDEVVRWLGYLVTIGGPVVVAVFGLVSGLVSGLVKPALEKALEKYIDTRLDRDRMKLEVENTKELERFKAQLAAEAHHQETAFAGIYTRRMEAIGQVYEALVEADDTLTSLTNPLQLPGEPSMEDKRERANAAWQGFYKAFQTQRVFLPDEVCTPLDDATEVHKKIWRHHTAETVARMFVRDPNLATRALEEHQAAWQAVSEKLPEIQKACRAAMQKLWTEPRP